MKFDEARRLAERAWPESPLAGVFPSMEPFVASPSGSEDRAGFLVRSAKPALDSAGMPAMDVPLVFVSKDTGDVTFEPIIMNFDRLDGMTPVGEPVSTT